MTVTRRPAMALPVEETTPYAWPYHGSVDPRRTALVVTGADESTAAGVPADQDALANIDTLRAVAADLGILVVIVAHRLEATGGRHGARPVVATPCAPITPRSGEVEVLAAGLDGFYGSALDAVLRRHQRSDLLLVGLGFETTVHSTLRRANDRGYECLVIADACASIDASLRAASVSSIEMSGGIFGAVGASQPVITAFRSAPGSPPTPLSGSEHQEHP